MKPPRQGKGVVRLPSDVACAQVYAGAYGIAVAQGIDVQVAQGAAKAAVEHFVDVMHDITKAR